MYALSYMLTKNKTLSLIAPPLLFFSPTYLLKFFSDQIVQPISYFSRFYPVLVDFPIFAATLLAVLFLLKNKGWKFAILSGILGGLLFYTYFYYWTFYIVFIGLLLATTLIRKDFTLSKKLTVSGLLTMAIGATFFLNSISTIANQAEILRRLNAILGRSLDWPITLFLFGIVILLIYINHWAKENVAKGEKTADYFLPALILAGIIVMNVQVIMGYTINPRHWLTTAIWPTLVLSGIYILNFMEGTAFVERKNLEKIIRKSSFIFICLLISFGIIWQVTFSYNTYSVYVLPSSQLELFEWLNHNTAKDEVVLTLSSEMILLVPVYTHNNNFVPNAVVEPIPISEIIARRLVAYKILGASEQNIIFLNNACAFSEMMSFERAKDGKYNYSLFEEAFSHLLTFEGSFPRSKGCAIPKEFKEGVFKAYAALPEDWEALVQKYQVDYIVVGPYEKEIIGPNLEEHAAQKYKNAEYIVYEINPSSESDPAKEKPCIEYCNCLQDICSAYAAENPFQNKESCLSACDSYTSEELKCWQYFCSTNTAKEEHLCEHAWGKFQLDECPS